MVSCPHCGEQTFSSWKVGFSKAGKELVCPSCGKSAYVPYWPVTLLFGILGVYFFGKLVVPAETAIAFLVVSVVFAVSFIHFSIRLLTPREHDRLKDPENADGR
jgi:hypothetical protein